MRAAVVPFSAPAKCETGGREGEMYWVLVVVFLCGVWKNSGGQFLVVIVAVCETFLCLFVVVCGYLRLFVAIC